MVNFDFEKAFIETLKQAHGVVLTYEAYWDNKNAYRKLYRANSVNPPTSGFVRLSNYDDGITRRFLLLLKESGITILRDVDAPPDSRRIDGV
jgi:hypothetical protein